MAKQTESFGDRGFMSVEIAAWIASQLPEVRAVCEVLCASIETSLSGAKGKVWHGSPVWFLDGNPVVGFASRKNGVQLLFWSGRSFDTPGLAPEGKFMAAHTYYKAADEIESVALGHWLAEAAVRQWDYENIVKRRGVLHKRGDW